MKNAQPLEAAGLREDWATFGLLPVNRILFVRTRAARAPALAGLALLTSLLALLVLQALLALAAVTLAALALLLTLLLALLALLTLLTRRAIHVVVSHGNFLVGWVKFGPRS
jgi:hypothetical protein